MGKCGNKTNLNLNFGVALYHDAGWITPSFCDCHDLTADSAVSTVPMIKNDAHM